MDIRTLVRPVLLTSLFAAVTAGQVNALDRNADKEISRTSSLKEMVNVREQTTTISRDALEESVEVVTQPCEQYPGNNLGSGEPESEHLTVCGPDSGIEFENAVYDPFEDEGMPYSGPSRAYDHFVPDANDFSLINADLLASASMYLYGPPGYQGDEELRFEYEMQGYGLKVVDYFDDPATDTQGAVMKNDDIILVAFRGTAGIEDMQTDARFIFTRMDDWDDSIHVHSGFLSSMDAVIDEVIDAVEEAGTSDKRVWITGHSLGAAIATLVAYRLHEIENIDVQGVYVFGSPKVGNEGFKDAYKDADLRDRTWRMELAGDPIPANFPAAPAKICQKVTMKFLFWSKKVKVCDLPAILSYRHVGITQQIDVEWNGSEFEYEFLDEERSNYPQMPATATGAFVEHVKYDNAMRYASEQSLDEDIVDDLPELIED